MSAFHHGCAERAGGPGSYRGVTAQPGSTFQPLFGARALAEWIRQGGTPARAPFGYSLRSSWHALWFELNWRTQLERMPPGGPPADPVFIVGLWRSGTTMLHELVNACGGWVTPRTWQCFHPSTCFLTGPPARAAAAKRPMDQGLIATQGPQEDEFALLLLGEPSIYRGLIDPRRLLECGRAAWSSDGGGLERWKEFIRGVSATGGMRLLLKSPGHTFRIPTLRKLFPGARFIWIGRHPGEVLASNVRMWTAMMSVYALWSRPDDLLQRFLRDAMRACGGVLERCIAEMTREQMMWVDFEALQTDPERVLRQILQFVGDRPGHGEQSLAADIGTALSSVPIHRGERAQMPEDESVLQLEGVMRAARQRFGEGEG
ncbi:MAG TPA: sulfotransferase [Steroidobacteraceae bacterium]|nr:sulfotransferase [Steroidobacteraceae bacterium]